MKKALAVTTVLAMVMMIGISSAWAGRVGKRQIRQDTRIAQGINSGELTRGETRHLVRQQRRIQHAKREAWSDGTLTRREKAGLELRQDKASGHIYRLKHNQRDRD
jgi:hypothetical protein